MRENDVILKADDLYFSYDDEKTHSLNGLSLEIQKGKKIAYVYSNNQLVGEYTLTEDYKTEFKVESGSGYNVIHIEGGKVWVQDASCPDKVCLHQGKISSDGEFIACLPNSLMITIEDTEKNENDSDIMTK